jgi:hypothetical protein
VIVAPWQLLFHQLNWEFKKRRPVLYGERARIHAQNENLRKLQPFRPVYRHQLNRVSWCVIVECNRPARLLEIIEVLQEFRKLSRLAFRFPFLHEFRQPLNVFSVLSARAVGNLQPLRQVRENFACRLLPDGFPLLAQQCQ